MITETIYTPEDLHHGVCDWCGEESDELIIIENSQEICVDCYEDEKFYQETMKDYDPD